MKLPPTPNQRIATALRQVTPAHAGGRTNLVAPTPGLPGRTNGPSPTEAFARFATIVIALDGSTAVGKASADYVCDGTADDVEIQAAIDSLNPGGGTIVILEGTANLAATVTVGRFVTLEGMGQEATTLDGNVAFAAFGAMALRHLHVTGNVTFTDIGESAVERCTIDGYVGGIITGTDAAQFVWIIDSLINGFTTIGGNHYGVAIDGSGATTQSLYHVFVARNSLYGGGVLLKSTPADVGNEGDSILVAENHIQGPILIDFVKNFRFASNSIEGNDLTIGESKYGSISGNPFHNGNIALTSCDHVALVGNIAVSETETTCTNISKAGNVGF